MKTRVQALLLGAAAALALGCAPTQPTPPPSSTTVIVNQNVGTGGNPLASPSPSAGACTIATVGNSLHGTSEQGGVKFANLRVGESRVLDTTPKGPGGLLIPDTCPLAAVSWSNTNPTACELNSSAVYTPTLRARAAGTCELRATVGSVTAGEPIVVSVAAATLWEPPALLPQDFDAARWEHTRTFVGRSAR